MMEVAIFILGWMLLYEAIKLVGRLIAPHLAKSSIIEGEKNPNWIMGDVKKKYYGFQDINIILAERKNRWADLPYFRITSDNKYEMLIPDDTPTEMAEDVLKMAMVGKFKIKYGLHIDEINYFKKPLYQLSIMCYLLDGGNIEVKDFKMEEGQ